MTTTRDTDRLLDRAVRAIWECLLGLDASRCGPAAPGSTLVLAWADVVGRSGGRVLLACPLPLARSAAARMFGAAAERMDVEDVEDAFAELAGILGGQMKGCFDGPSRVSTSGALLLDPPGEAPQGLSFSCEGQTFVAALEYEGAGR